MPATWCVHRYHNVTSGEWHYDINQLKIDNPKAGHDNYAQSPNDAVGEADMEVIEVPHLSTLAAIETNTGNYIHKVDATSYRIDRNAEPTGLITCPNNGKTYGRVRALANNARLSRLHASGTCSNPILFRHDAAISSGNENDVVRIEIAISVRRPDHD